MAARAMWKGVLQIGSEAVPVKLYSAIEDRSVHFRLLDEKSGEPVRQQLIDPSQGGELVAYDEVRRGFAIGDDFVVLHKEELDALAPKPSREITISRFVAPQKLGAEWYVRPYYLGPDGDEEGYFALARALADEGKEGIAHWVMRNLEYSGVLREEQGYLLMITLRHADEIIAREDLPRPEGRAHSDKERKMAEQLVAAYEDLFDPTQYRDEYRERVLAFVEAKAQGQKPKLKRVLAKPSEERLSDALAKSLASIRKERRVA